MKKRHRILKAQIELNEFCDMIRVIREEITKVKRDRPELNKLGWKRFFLLCALHSREVERGSVSHLDVLRFYGIGKTSKAKEHFFLLISEGALIEYPEMTVRNTRYKVPRACVSPSYLILIDRVRGALLRRMNAQPDGIPQPFTTTKAASKAAHIFEEVTDRRK